MLTGQNGLFLARLSYTSLHTIKLKRGVVGCDEWSSWRSTGHGCLPGACIERDSRLGLQSAPPFAPALSDPPIPLFVIGSHTLGEPPASAIVHRHSLSAEYTLLISLLVGQAQI